jgi:hypothetical protein
MARFIRMGEFSPTLRRRGGWIGWTGIPSRRGLKPATAFLQFESADNAGITVDGGNPPKGWRC